MLLCIYCVVECLIYYYCLNKYYIIIIRKLLVVIMLVFKFFVKFIDFFNMVIFVFLI